MMVMVAELVPLLAVRDVGEDVRDDRVTETSPGTTVTVAVWVIGVPPIVADTVLVPVVVELRAPVATPVALVAPAGWVSVLPVPVVDNTTVAPPTGFANASRAVTVMLEATPPPLAWMLDGEALTVDVPAETGPALTVTEGCTVSGMPFTVAVTTFTSATVELRDPVAVPFEPVTPTGWVIALPVPVAASVTDAPEMGFPKASRATTVAVAALEPLLATIAPGAPATNGLEVAPVAPAAAAVSVYPVPALSRLRSSNVATPAVALRVAVPESTAPPGFVPSASVTDPLNPVAVFPKASRTVTSRGGVIATPAAPPVG